jgi:hypothetical protein
MSVRLPPFRIGTDPAVTNRIPDSISLARLTEALRGHDPIVSALAALRVLGASDLPEKNALIASVLRNRELGADARRQAAILLAYANSSESQALLLEALADSDPRVQAAAAKGLGWIGDSAAYAPLVALMRSPSGNPAKQAEWAARLVAHREGLGGRELPSLRLAETVEFTSERRPVRVLRARPQRLRLCLESIARRNFRLRLEPSLAHELQCGRSEWMLLLTDDAARAPASLWGRRSIAAAVALFIEEEPSFSIALIVLVEPSGQLIVCRSTGEPVFAGALDREGNGAAFSVRAIARPGAFPLIVEGSGAPGDIVVREAVSGPIVIPKRRPVPIDLTPT